MRQSVAGMHPVARQNNLVELFNSEQSGQENPREGVMRGLLRKTWLGAILGSVTGAAGATPLTVVTVAAPDINCVFEIDCTVVVTDSIGTISIPSMTGTGRLQSRTFAGQAGAPGAG